MTMIAFFHAGPTACVRSNTLHKGTSLKRLEPKIWQRMANENDALQALNCKRAFDWRQAFWNTSERIQEASKRAPRRPKRAPRRPKRRPRRPKRAPRRAQEGPKQGTTNRKSEPTAPRSPQEAPRGPKEAPRGPQEPPKTPQEAQNCLTEAPERPTARSQPTSTRPHTHNKGTVVGLAEGQ